MVLNKINFFYLKDGKKSYEKIHCTSKYTAGQFIIEKRISIAVLCICCKFQPDTFIIYNTGQEICTFS